MKSSYKMNSYNRRRFYWVMLVTMALALEALIIQAAAQNAASQPMLTHESIWLMQRVGAPAPSPDGKWVVFSLVEPAYDPKDQISDLWIVPTDGRAKARRLTFTKGGESDLAWSPDSQKLAFSAKREGDEVNQVYVMDIGAGGEAIRVTTLSTGARSPKWRPDGKALLFASTVFPGADSDEANKKIAAERKDRKYKARVYDSFPIRHWDKWLDDTQPHLFIQTLEPGAKARDLLAGTQLVKERGFAGRMTDSGEELDAVWTPDGQEVIFAATTARHTAAYAEYATSLYKVSAAGGEPQPFTAGDGNYAKPRFSPDGKALYCLFTPKSGKAYNLDRIARFAWPLSGPRQIVTANFDRSVASYALTPDSRSIFLLAEDAGHDKLYSVPAAGGKVTLTIDMNLGIYTHISIPEKAASTIIVANWESATNPAEVARIDPVAKRHQFLTDFNAPRAAALNLPPLRHFWFTSQRGKRIHNLLALPPNFDESKKYPLFVVIHGGPHGMWKDQFVLRWNYHLLAQPGYVVLLTNYTGSTGFGEKFAQDIQGDPLAGPGAELNEAADEAIRQFKFIDGTRQAAGGASYGGHLANWLQATTTRYKCLISHAGLINLESQWGTSDTIYHREVNNGGPVWEQGAIWREQNPIRYASKFRTPILITAGENDFRVPLNQDLENWSVLQRLRVPSRLIIFPEENHWILKGENSRFFYQEVHAWLKKYLGNGKND